MDQAAETETKQQDDKATEVLSKFSKEDGEVDVKALAHNLWVTQQKLNSSDRENKDRRLANETRMKELEERDQKLKSIEEEEMKKQQKYEELLKQKDDELSKAKEAASKIDELEKFREQVVESQKKSIADKIAQLGKDQRELYETAADAMAEDAYDKKLALLDKLSVKKPQPATLPSGGLGTEADPESLIKLKESDPKAYRKAIRERISKSEDNK